VNRTAVKLVQGMVVRESILPLLVLVGVDLVAAAVVEVLVTVAVAVIALAPAVVVAAVVVEVVVMEVGAIAVASGVRVDTAGTRRGTSMGGRIKQ
jgi:hypothetical protein